MNGLQEANIAGKAKTADSSPIADATCLIEKEVCRLRETVTALDTRLSSLLIDPQPQCEQGKDPVEPAKSPLLMFMDNTERAIRSQRCRLESYLDRLQV